MFQSRFAFLLFGVIAVESFATEAINSEQFLLDQVLWGELFYRDDFVKDSLYRLQLIDPDNPKVMAAQIRLAIRQKNLALANKLLGQLKQKAPDSIEYRQAQMSIYLAQPSARQMLQQARLTSMSGHTAQAKEQYDALFHGNLPTPEISAEYWTLVAKLPGQQQKAFQQLQMLYSYLQEHKIYSKKNPDDSWVSGLQNTISGIWASEGNDALDKNKLALAQEEFEKALQLNQSNYSALAGIGDIAFEQKDFANAEKAYKQAIVINPDRESAVYGLFKVYRQQSLQKALQYFESLSEVHKLKLAKILRELKSDILDTQAEQLVKANQWKEAVDKYSQAHKMDPENVWLIYHYALALTHIGQAPKANQLFQQLAARQKDNPEQVYAYALYLSNQNKIKQAITHIHTLSRKKWNEDIRQLAQRLATEQTMLYAQALHDRGDKQAAIAFLLRQPQTIPIRLTLADWAFNDNDFPTALRYYQDVLRLQPLNPDASLGLIETKIALGDTKGAHDLLEKIQNRNMSLNPNMQRRVANAWFATGEKQKALTLFNHLKQAGAKANPSQDSALLFRDAARAETASGLPKLAKEDYRKSMINSQITSFWPATNDYYTLLTRNHKEDDWLKRSIRSDAALLYLQQETRVTVDQDYWRLTGTAGTSDLRAQDTIAQADWGLYDGRAFLRADDVALGAGTFTTVNGIYFSDFGSCNINGCTTGTVQKTNGIGWDGGWQNARWGMDIGQTPVGFPVGNWVGGINYSGELQHVGWTLTASRRPMTNSLLSFSGAVDPGTGIVWGGVVATGLTLSLSYDRGEANGFWANIIASELTGKNVPNNERILLLDGYYYKIINEDNRRLSIGLTNMLWHYNKDLFGYTLGEGGYYSPQMFLSFTIPVDYRQRTGNWSYELGGTVTWSRATTQNSLLYPLPNLIPNLNSADNPLQSGSTSNGYGYSVLALIERRLGSHFMIGGLVNIQQSTDYTPSHLSLFLRYSFEGWQGDMDMPIIPLVPYSAFR